MSNHTTIEPDDNSTNVFGIRNQPNLVAPNSIFVTNPKVPVIIQDESFVKVYDLYDQLSTFIEGLDTKIDDILNKHENDFVHSYRASLYKVQQELKDLRRRTDETEIKIRQNEQIQTLEKNLKIFREESLKLTESVNRKNKEIQSLNNKVKFLEDERAFLTSYLKTMASKARENKGIITQGQDESTSVLNPTNRSNIPKSNPINSNSSGILEPYSSNKHRSLSGLRKKDKDSTIFSLSKVQGDDNSILEFNTGFPEIDGFLNDLKEKDFQDKTLIIENIRVFIVNLVTSYEKKINIMKKDLDRELKCKIKILSQRTGELSSKSDLEYLFIDCVEQVRREIFKRRGCQKIFYDKIQKNESNESFDSNSNPQKVEYKHFLNSDKYRILEFFLTHEKVLVALYEKIFLKPDDSAVDTIKNNNPNMLALNTTVDIGTLGNQKETPDLLIKDSSGNMLNNPGSRSKSVNMSMHSDTVSLPNVLKNEKKKLPDFLIHKPRNPELVGDDTKKKINEILADSGLYTEIKFSTSKLIPKNNEGFPSRRKSEWKPNMDGKRFKI